MADLEEIIVNRPEAKVEILDRLFKSENVDPQTFPRGGIIFSLPAKLRRGHGEDLTSPPGQAIASTCSTRTDDQGPTPCPTIANSSSATGPSDNTVDTDASSQNTSATPPGISRTVPYSTNAQVSTPTTENTSISEDNGAGLSFGVGLFTKPTKRPVDGNDSQYEDGATKGSKRMKLLNLVSRGSYSSDTSWA